MTPPCKSPSAGYVETRIGFFELTCASVFSVDFSDYVLLSHPTSKVYKFLVSFRNSLLV
ncbi:hypothetical protein PITC_053800 [Penicillium italicum]|uniref:Uncharacterized protein n=1 Tax=Penicillium italicum TaxID=40296 RepID=A0A0A2KJZ3_PENIT|nr:hypothetical protein PITC_053800 [Penicillium italicum]